MDDFLQRWSLPAFGIAAALYTLVTFANVGTVKAMVFSKRNAIPASTVLTVHLQFLTALLVLMWAATAVYPSLPAWMQGMWFRGRGSRSSTLDLIFLLGLGLMSHFEQKRIYLERDTEPEVAS